MHPAILGMAGYSGQETLDRVLAHPVLEVVALGSGSVAGRPASALDPRLSRNGASAVPAFVPNAEAAIDDDFLAAVGGRGEELRAGLDGLGAVREARGLGLLVGAELDRPAAPVVGNCLERVSS
jgi:N-acetyl-gamma-glutamylphosphate reductase